MTKISELPNTTSANAADILPLVQDGVTKKISKENILNGVVTDGDSRLTNARTPTGNAGGDLGGTYPNPTINTVPINKGGTGSTTAGGARTALSVPAISDLTSHTGNTSNPHSVTASQVGAIATSARGAANGVASLDSGGLIPDAEIPATITRDSELTAGLSTKADSSALTSHTGNTSNPHSVTAAQVGNTTAQWNASQLQGISVSTTAPANGQVLKYNGTAWTPSTDETASGGEGGEINTGSNVGVGGVGVFKQKTGTNLEFRNVNAGSNKINVALDAVNNEIDLDVNENNLTLGSIGGTLPINKGGTGSITPGDARTALDVPSNSDFTSHTGNTSNPHSVTAAQVGNTTAQWNASQLQGVSVSDTSPTNGQVLKYNGTLWIPSTDETGGGGGAVPGLGYKHDYWYYTHKFTGNSVISVQYGWYIYSPFIVTDNVIVESIANENTTTNATGTLLCGLYTSVNGLPTTLIREFGKIPLNTAGVTQYPAFSPLSLNAGVYWLCHQLEGTTSSVSFRSMTASIYGNFYVGSDTPGNTTAFSCYRTVNRFPDVPLPATAETTLIQLSSVAPVTWFKA
jgi:hypothetical protein